MLIAMSIATALLGLVIQALGRATQDQQDIERRTQMQTDAQIGLEQMTREIRQAEWLQFRSSAVIDMSVKVRATASSDGVSRLVRYDCSGDTCRRYEGAAVNYPPPAAPTFATSEDVIGAPAAEKSSRRGYVVGHDVFRPTSVDPMTGATAVNFVEPDFLTVRLQLEIAPLYPRGRTRRITIEDGVTLRNVTEYAS